jgi:hypothetical protein
MWQREPASVVLCVCGSHVYVVCDLIYACAGFLMFVGILSEHHVINYRIRTPLICLIMALLCPWSNSGPSFSPASEEVFYLCVEVWNIKFMRGTCCNNTINLLKILNGNIEVVCFVIGSGSKLNIGGKGQELRQRWLFLLFLLSQIRWWWNLVSKMMRLKIPKGSNQNP